MENKKLIPIAVILLAASIVFSSIWIGRSIEKIAYTEKKASAPAYSEILNLTQVAEYLNMSEDKVLGIIRIEKTMLEKSGSFTGKMFPYFIVDDKQYFYKSEIDEWLKEVSRDRKIYNTAEGWRN